MSDIDTFISEQLTSISRRFGAPQYHRVILPVASFFDPLGKDDRYGEVCMVIRRPDGDLITARKRYYPTGIYRLLTGGIRHGEPILDALAREAREETGLEVETRRFLAAIDYRAREQRTQQVRRFVTFVFLLDEVGGTLGCVDPEEELESFGLIVVDDLPELVRRLEALPPDEDARIGGRWRDWGRFRAVAHRLVYDLLRAAGS